MLLHSFPISLPVSLWYFINKVITPFINVEIYNWVVNNEFNCKSNQTSFTFSAVLCYITFPFSHPDALLADLENTGSPLARCPVLLTSEPPQNADPTTQDTTQARPPPPAYTPQQVDTQQICVRTNFLINESGLHQIWSNNCELCLQIFFVNRCWFFTKKFHWLSICVASQTVSAAMKSSQNSNPDKLYR